MNILGIGVDIIEIYRIKNAVNRNNKFLGRVFTKEEIDYFESKNFKIETIAGNFAAKEAVSKAFGTGIRNFRLTDIEILRNDLGKPYVKLYNNLYELSEKLKITEIMISISHCKEYAVANAIILKGGNDFES
ncbi:holo-ACP synthase [Tepidibacter formicigenes]|jgi:holo-[acyl-carrier protein] synthase|uniref:Holo-[acyl-carrier-protein] synthase n=1 Tax=Tepidibacter formicigenes DSM 15518 TaxID=1123349 RepID=A0A1M6MRZ5_9FIRM|nr:holo-ACP synthase [Tepidibacter formicigenes]SHJ86053.1 holo-[acyl-carrier protein] synthase [Tepidibacter formicigenes DSM 15518]